MRRPSVLAPVLVLLAPLLLLVGSAPAPGHAQGEGLATYRFLPAQVFGPVAVGMPDERTVSVQHRDAATGAWDAPTVLYRARGRVTCGDIEGAASTGVALLVECDAPYYEDQAPVHSVALVTVDGRTWSRRRLPGEAYRAPAISPSATYAAWLTGGTGAYVEWSAGAGFARPAATTYRSDSSGETVVVDDAGTVTVIGPEPTGRRCVVGIHSRDLSGARTHATIDTVDPGCTEGRFETVDASTVLGGGSERALQFTLTRPAAGAPWSVAAGRPVEAPGLVSYGYGRGRISTHFVYSTVPGAPIVAVGSPDRHRVLAQVFDEATGTWGPQTQLLDSARRCGLGLQLQPETAFYVDVLRCRGSDVALVSPDARTWTVRDTGRRAWATTDLGVALPGRRGTTVVRTDGVEEFPVTTDGPCDVVQAGRPGELVRLHGGRHAWPGKVQVSTGDTFRTVSRARRPAEPCREVVVEPDRLWLNGSRHAREAQLVLRGGTWRLVYLR